MQNPRFAKQVADIVAKLEITALSSEWDLQIDISKDTNGHTLSLSLKDEDEGGDHKDQIIAECKDALLRAAQESTCACVLGYALNPFQTLANGFTATLGEIEDASWACWDIFAMGACPHGSACARTHPTSMAYLVVQFVAEAYKSTANAWQNPPSIHSTRFGKQAADVVAKIEIAALSSEWDVEVSIAKSSNGFNVAVMMADEDVAHWDELAAEVKETLLQAAQESTNLYVLGYANNAFRSTPRGFVATLGEMQDPAWACWDIYAMGCCQYGNACHRQHLSSVATLVVKLIGGGPFS
jgi:hypothetical protein